MKYKRKKLCKFKDFLFQDWNQIEEKEHISPLSTNLKNLSRGLNSSRGSNMIGST